MKVGGLMSLNFDPIPHSAGTIHFLEFTRAKGGISLDNEERQFISDLASSL